MAKLNSRMILAGLLLCTALYGAVAGIYGARSANPPCAATFGFVVLIVAGVFLWYCADANEQGFRRTPALSGAVLLFAPAAVPYYLFRSRRAGQRSKALLRCAVYCVLNVAVLLLVAVPVELLIRYG